MIRELKLSSKTETIQIKIKQAGSNIKAKLIRKGNKEVFAPIQFIDTENGISSFKMTAEADNLPYGFYTLIITSGKDNTCICAEIDATMESCKSTEVWSCDAETARPVSKPCIDQCVTKKEKCPPVESICQKDEGNKIERENTGINLPWYTTRQGKYTKCNQDETNGEL